MNEDGKIIYFAGRPLAAAIAADLELEPNVAAMFERVLRVIEAEGETFEAIRKFAGAVQDEVAIVHVELERLREENRALANRLESLTRSFHSRTDHLA